MAKKDEKDGKNDGAGVSRAPRRGSGQAAVEVEDTPREAPEGARDAQVTGPGGEPAVRIRVDEREMSSSYANAFRTNGTDEEVILDFGRAELDESGGAGRGGAGVPAGLGTGGRDHLQGDGPRDHLAGQ